MKQRFIPLIILVFLGLSMSSQAQTTELPLMISGMDVSHDGSFIAISYGGGECNRSVDNYYIEIRNTSTDELLRTLRGHTCTHYPVWSPSGRKIVSSGYDGTVRIWDVETGEEIASGEGVIQNGTFSLTWSPDESLLAGIGGYNGVRLYNSSTGESLGRFNPEIPVYSVRWHPNDVNRIATAEEDGAIRIRNLEGNVLETFFVTDTIVHTVFWNKNGTQLLALSNGQIFVVDALNGSILHTIEWTHGWYTFRYSSDSRLIVAGNADGLVSIWEAETGNLIQEIDHSLIYADAVIAKIETGIYRLFHGGVVPRNTNDVPLVSEEIAKPLAQSQDNLRGLLSYPDCVSSCWLGIQPNISTSEDLEYILGIHGIEYEKFPLGQDGSNTFFYSISSGYSNQLVNPIVVYTRDGIVTTIDTAPHDIEINTVIAEYGYPEQILEDGTSVDLIYRDEGLVFGVIATDHNHVFRIYISSPQIIDFAHRYFWADFISCTDASQLCSLVNSLP